MLQDVLFNISFHETLHTITIAAYGFEVEIRRGLRVDPTTQQYQEVYSVLMDKCRPLALSQTELSKYIMFLEYVEFYLQNLNA